VLRMDHAGNIDRDIRGKRSSCVADRLIADLAERQHGVVALRQLEALGLPAGAIEWRLRVGRLHALHRAVYAVGHRPATKEARWMAAVLTGGSGAVLSHHSAAAHWGIRRTGGMGLGVTAPGRRRSRDGIAFHRSVLPPDERTVHDGIPITTVPRTLFDIAATLNLRQLERAVNEAEIRRLWDDLSLPDLLRRYPRRKGSRNVRRLLDKRSAGANVTESDLEVLFLSFADRHGLPQPETNSCVEGFWVDCVWRAERVVLELDSWEFHRTRSTFESDRRKIRVLQARHWRCVPVTYRQLTEDAEEVAGDVRRLLAPATLAA